MWIFRRHGQLFSIFWSLSGHSCFHGCCWVSWYYTGSLSVLPVLQVCQRRSMMVQVFNRNAFRRAPVWTHDMSDPFPLELIHGTRDGSGAPYSTDPLCTPSGHVGQLCESYNFSVHFRDSIVCVISFQRILDHLAVAGYDPLLAVFVRL